MILAIDPSIRSTGVAIFAPGGVLKHAARVQQLDPSETRGAQVRHMAREIVRWAQARHTGEFEVAVYEWPQVYTTAKSKGDPNDLIALAAIGAAAAAQLGIWTIITPTPREWAGTSRKATKGDPWRSPRAAGIAATLTPAERALVPASHDAIVAVGLGLWALGRKPRRVLAGTT